MPVMDMSTATKRTGEAPQFERLKLRKGEKARIVFLENPTFAWAHVIRAPKIVDGVAVKTMRRRRSGDEYVDYDMDFIGRPLCVGDLGILTEKGVDPKNCPVCARAVSTDEVLPPERRFAMNIIRYGLNADGTSLVTPFSCTCVVWAFSEGIFNKLVDIRAEHGDLIGRDLLLGPCTEESFQKYEIQPGAKNAWQLDPNVGRLVVETFKANRIPDLDQAGACGRKVDIRWMRDDLETVSYRWRVARGTVSVPDGTEALDRPSLTEGLNDLLGAVTSPAQTASASPVGAVPAAVDLDALLSTPTPPPSAASTPALDISDLLGDSSVVGAPAAAAMPASPPAPPSGDPIDFESLLKSL